MKIYKISMQWFNIYFDTGRGSEKIGEIEAPSAEMAMSHARHLRNNSDRIYVRRDKDRERFELLKDKYGLTDFEQYKKNKENKKKKETEENRQLELDF